MNALGRQTLARKLEYLRKQLEHLELYRVLPKKEILGSVEKRLTVERLLEISLQSVIDMSRLLVALEDWRRARDERDALLLLEENGVLGPALVERLLRAKGFRNVLAHEYVEIDPERLYEHLATGVEDLWAFAEGMADWLK